MAGKSVSQTECAAIFGVHRNTLAAWLTKGCPYIQKANKPQGKDWLLDTADVAQWREQQAINNTVGDLSKVSEDELKRRRLAAETGKAEIELAKLRGEVVLVDVQEKIFNHIMIAIQTRMLMVGGRCAMHLLMVDDETKIKSLIDEEIRQGLSESAEMDIDDE